MCSLLRKGLLLILPLILLISVSSFQQHRNNQYPLHSARWSDFRNVAAAATTRLSSRRFLSSTSSDGSSNIDEQKAVEKTPAEKVKLFLKKKYSSFYQVMEKNPQIWTTLKENGDGAGCTIFAPSNQAFEELGEKKLQQLEDPRNLETVEKMISFHVIPEEAVPAELLFREDWTALAASRQVSSANADDPKPLTIGGIKTLGGDVPVGRMKSGGGFLGIGAKEDGDVVVGPNAKVVQSFKVAGVYLVHEVDALVSPLILWRYCDQLRMPGF